MKDYGEAYFYQITVMLEKYGLTIPEIVEWFDTIDSHLGDTPRNVINGGNGDVVVDRAEDLGNTCYACKINCKSNSCYTNRDKND